MVCINFQETADVRQGTEYILYVHGCSIIRSNHHNRIYTFPFLINKWRSEVRTIEQIYLELHIHIMYADTSVCSSERSS